MKKKLLVLLIVVSVLIPATLSASIVNLSIGATAQYNENFAAMQTSIENDTFATDFAKMENYSFGADVRLKILLAEIDLVGMFGKDTVDSIDYTTISVLTSAGISLDILSFARIGFGMGPRFNVLVDKDMNTVIKDDSGVAVEDMSGFGEAFINSPVAYRATLDFKLGNILLGLNYTVDSNYTFKEWQKVEDLFSKPLDQGTVGISLLFSLF